MLGQCPSDNPCSSKTWKDILEPRRSQGTVQRPQEPTVCDANLPSGWYRFRDETNSNTLKIPRTSCIDRNRCGTLGPVFISESSGSNPMPEDGTVLRKACISILGRCCHAQLDVCLRNCGASGMVYYLGQTPGCPMAYCTGIHTL